MQRLIATVALSLALVSGCGASGGSEAEQSPGSSSEPTAPATSEPQGTYFAAGDTDAINAVASRAQSAGIAAQDPARAASCNAAGDRGYRVWRACWHDLLDPLSSALGGLAREFGTLAGHDLPDGCVAALEDARTAVTGFGAEVDALLAGIDSDEQKAQRRAARDYQPTLASIAQGYAEPFQALTQVCYSPQDLASINARPSPSP